MEFHRLLTIKNVTKREFKLNYFQLIEKNQKSATEKSSVATFTRVYFNSHLALFDVVTSLQQFMSHKPKIGIFRNGSSVIECLISQFLKNQTPIQFKTPQQNFVEYIESIDKESCFVIWASENEITGEPLYSAKDILEIHQRLSAKRIFSIQVRLPHEANLNLQAELFKSAYAICVDAPDIFNSARAIAKIHFTDKLKAPTLVGSFQFASEDLAPIAPSKRKAFHFKNVSGSIIKSHMQWSDQMAFAPADLPSWVTDSWKNWWPEASGHEFLRGLLVLNTGLITDQDLDLQITKATNLIEQQMSWPVDSAESK